MELIFICSIIFLLVPPLDGSKILIFYPFSTKSHLNTLMPVANELIARGHQVDFVTMFADYKVNAKIKVHHTPILQDFDEEMEKFIHELNKFSFIMDILMSGTVTEQICESIFENDRIQKLIALGKRFDVIIINSIFNECSVAVSSLLANYTVIANAGPVSPWSYNPSPSMASVIPNYMLPFPPEMTFQQRLFNVLFIIFTKIVFAFDVYPRGNAVVQKYYPGAPSIQTAWKNASLYLVNIDNIVFSPRPIVPRIINLPGIRCKDKQRLPQEFENFIQGSGSDGFIIFSLGTLADSRYLKREILEQFVLAFSKIKQRVIWKFVNSSLELPKNVKTFKWIPQTDLLGHEKVRLFISHGGLLGLQEAICYGVPIIGFPLFADQPSNLARIHQLGFAEVLDITTFSAQELVQTIQKILNHNSYRENVRKYTPILKDYLEPAAKKGAFWIEYVIRHHGAKHLRSEGEDMGLIQYFLVDVFGFICFVLGFTFFVLYKIIRLCFAIFKNRTRLSHLSQKKRQ